ncbi:hypothetical protein [Polaribacter marinivivus]|jgi:hypothetical protein|uniref:hypothetical protein n=1 Tax=Polaribacter marinivivus TaxID=1524260 RepID=UPI003D328D15
MENILKYYQFSAFKKDESGIFSGNEISYSILNDTHFLIFEKEKEIFNLYVTRYTFKKDIGINKPEIIETLVNNYDKSKPEHRIILKQYFQ